MHPEPRDSTDVNISLIGVKRVQGSSLQLKLELVKLLKVVCGAERVATAVLDWADWFKATLTHDCCHAFSVFLLLETYLLVNSYTE